ncbi:MAG: chlorophyllase/cutinase-like alpha/beta fold protein [Aminipila sp.]
MNILKGILKVIGFIVLVIIILVICVVAIFSYRSENYYKYLKTDENLEKKYSELGAYDVSYKSIEADSDIWKEYVIYYPTELENSSDKYPVVVVANGTGITATKYKTFFKHLASWGFIVIGNEDENSRNGESSSMSLDYILKLNEDKNSVFYNKVDIENIGIKGHSQGGVGAINAINNWDNGNMYKVLYTASITSHYHSKELGDDWGYNETKITIPYFFIAGTGGWDSGSATSISDMENPQGISPLYAMNNTYNNIKSEYKVMGRLVNVDHGDTFKQADGYMTAWFLWHLQSNTEASKVFLGDDAEILNNKRYQDVLKSF